MTDTNHPLNADVIYAAMAWLRDYAESEEGQKAPATGGRSRSRLGLEVVILPAR